MRNTTKDKNRAAARGAFCSMIAVAVVSVVVFASGDSSAASGNGVSLQQSNHDSAVAGVLLSPRTRLIIDYQRVALA